MLWSAPESRGFGDGWCWREVGQIDTSADFLRTGRYAHRMDEPGVTILIYLLVAVAAVVISYWVIRLAVNHGIRDSRKPEKEKAVQQTAPPTQPWFSKDA